MLNRYETTFILSSVLTEEQSKKTIKKYVDFVKKNGAEELHEEHWGLKKLAYPIKHKTSGIYHLVEYTAPASIVSKLELQFVRDENVLRFLTVKFDKYAADYNHRRRNGQIGRKKEKQTASEEA